MTKNELEAENARLRGGWNDAEKTIKRMRRALTQIGAEVRYGLPASKN